MTVYLEGAEPIQVLAVPRAAVLSDQQGDYVFTVDAANKAHRTDIKLGQSTPTVASVISGLERGRHGHRPRPAAGPRGPSRGAWAGLRAADAHDAIGDLAGGPLMISALFVDRPRLAIVISIIITIAGAISLTRIPVSQFPEIVPPQVLVSATYPGASAAVVESSVAQPLEAQMVGVDRMIYMKSNSLNDGTYSLTVSFELGTNPDIDTVNVNNRVQTALVAVATGGSAPGPCGAQAIVGDPAIPAALQRDRCAGSAVHHQLRDDQRARRIVPHAGRRTGEPVRQAQLLDAHLVRHAAPRRASTWRRPTSPLAIQSQNVQAPIGRIGARPMSDRPAAAAQPADARPLDHAGGVRPHRRPRQSGWLGPARARCRARRNGRTEPRQRKPPQRQARRWHRRLPGARRQRRSDGKRPCRKC